MKVWVADWDGNHAAYMNWSDFWNEVQEANSYRKGDIVQFAHGGEDIGWFSIDDVVRAELVELVGYEESN